MDIVNNSAPKKILVDIEHRTEHYDDCNALVLPAKKKKRTKNADKRTPKTRLLSKKRRKELEKVVERKKKKLQRATLLEELAKVQPSPGELEQYVSLTSLQNKGLKRHYRELETPAPKVKREMVINTIKGSNKKKKRLALLDSARKSEAASDPNVVGLEVSSESSDDDVADDNITIPEITADEKSKSEDLREDAEKPQQIEKLRKVEVCTPAVFVPLNRKPEIQAARLKLPIVSEEQLIIETVNENPVIIITGETGSGKTTQVPQFLYEAGYAREKMIGITEPRRIAAMSMSKRVAEEMNLSEKEVSYLIRFEGNVTEETKIKFMTDGVLLKEIQSDFFLTRYSVIILDEAHERSVNTDVLIGFLSRIVRLRNKRNNPLKLIIMSATLRIEDFIDNTRLFKTKPSVITVEARQFPVTIYFNRRTKEDYVKEAVRKAIKIHTRLPDGGILIFVTGQQEVHTVIRKLRKAFPLKKIQPPDPPEETTKKEDSYDDDEEEETEEALEETLRRNKQRRKKQRIVLPTIDLDDYSVIPVDGTHEDPVDAQDDEDEDEDEDVDFKGLASAQPLWTLPLYSMLPAHKQAKVFKPPPKGCRLCVVSTNVAETSLTIPNIRYVVDSGRCKIRIYDKETGVSKFQISYLSKAAAGQRTGRAGRTGPGYCYRLYSSAVYTDFDEYGLPEIRRRPVDDLLLQMKAMNVPNVVNFPFPTPPDIVQLKTAENRLTLLGALEAPKKKEEMYCTKVTSLGRSIAAFPVAPCYGKMLALSIQHDLMRYIICMVAALSVQEVLIEALNMEGPTKTSLMQFRQYWAGEDNSLLLGDPMVLIKAIAGAESAEAKGELEYYCKRFGLRHKAVVEIRKLRQQLTNEINLHEPGLSLTVDPKMPTPTDTEARLLRQIVLAGMAAQVARKVLPDETKDPSRMKSKYAYRTPEMEEPMYMQSSCVLRKTCPEWVVYQEVYQDVQSDRMYMRGVTAIEPEWLPKFVPALCSLTPLNDPPPR